MPWDVDRVLYDFGLPMGPFAMSDLAGLDIGWSKETSKSSTIREILCEMDRRGQKTGAGFYDYDEDRNAKPSPVVEKIILDFAAKKGINRRTISDEEILERCIYPMINEGAKILEEGKAQRASDIDIVWINGYGWPVYRGGPMFYADLIGPDKVLAKMKEFEATMGADFTAGPAARKAGRRKKALPGPLTKLHSRVAGDVHDRARHRGGCDCERVRDAAEIDAECCAQYRQHDEQGQQDGDSERLKLSQQPPHPDRQNADQNATAIERRNWKQIKYRQHNVEQHGVAQVGGKPKRDGIRQIANKMKGQRGDDRKRNIHRRPRSRNQYHVAPRRPQRAKINRDRFGVTKQKRRMQEQQHAREQNRADGINVF